MKRAIFSIILFLYLTVPGQAREYSTRAGITFGGSGFISLSIERHFGANSIRLNVGVFELNELMLAATFNHYFTDAELRPFAGIGLWNVFIFPEQGTGRIDIITLPVGLDWNVKREHYTGAEADFNFFLHGRTPMGGKVEFNKRFMVLPGVYYKYRL